MKQLQSSDIRQMFVDFFKEKGHDVEPSAPLVPQDDPSLLWINSGVATLKKYFDGRVVPKNPRIVNVQKAIRTNDIENVGFTARHHTFFEMLGNFSIGDYFKPKAIEWAWEFLTSDKWIGFEPQLLSVTVHPEDDEAYNIWLNEIGLPEHRIIRLEENFWDIGEGPSGPNTEIFYDRGETYGNDPNDPELYPGGENSRYLEIWNLVFSQFNHNPDHTYTPLPNKNIDTGLGLERLVSIIQDVPTNYETDLFKPIIEETASVTNKPYGENESDDTAYKVIADHIRTVSFALADNALPSNEGRGYVIRRLLRRAVRFAKHINIDKPFMYQLVPVVGDIMQAFYPEVKNQEEHIAKVIKKEEERFHETLEDGLTILSQIMQREKEKGSTVFPGEDVFRLSDTYGFPKELTEEYVEEAGFTIDNDGFERELEKQRERARQARGKVDSMQTQNETLASADIESEFVGYDDLNIQTVITGIFDGEQFVKSADAGKEVYLFLKQTPFYAESGGQIADSGMIYNDHAAARIMDIQQAPKGQHIHKVHIEDGTLMQGLDVTATVESAFRSDIIKNHTATHILHKALKDVLGEHVNQAGSLVTPDRLRFDFSHYNAVTETELSKIEHIVNEKIWADIPVEIQTMPLDEAKQKGAIALFGEKYSDMVRVVEVGDYSIELCGGCHVSHTSDIGLMKLTMETGIGAGTRRIEAVTSKYAYEFVNNKLQTLKDASTQLKTTEDNVPERIEGLLQEKSNLEKEIESLGAKLSHMEAETLLNQVEEVDGIPLLLQQVQVKNMDQLRNLVDELKQKLASGVILLGTHTDGKVQLASGVSKDLVDRGLHAGNLIKHAAEITGGGGGGRPDMAQAGGKHPEKIDEALQSAKSLIKNEITA